MFISDLHDSGWLLQEAATESRDRPVLLSNSAKVVWVPRRLVACTGRWWPRSATQERPAAWKVQTSARMLRTWAFALASIAWNRYGTPPLPQRVATGVPTEPVPTGPYSTIDRLRMDMSAWIGLIGVAAGALVALIGQYLVRNSEARERRDTILLEQLATLVALSEDFRNRVWEERNKVAANVVAAWDLGTFRLAEARLRILCSDKNMLSALASLHDAGGELGRSWRLAPGDETRTQAAWKAHRAAIDQFIDTSSQVFRRQ